MNPNPQSLTERARAFAERQPLRARLMRTVFPVQQANMVAQMRGRLALWDIPLTPGGPTLGAVEHLADALETSLRSFSERQPVLSR